MKNKLDIYVVEAAEREIELRPLLLFKGNLTEHRCRSLFAVTRFLRDNEIMKFAQAESFLTPLETERHTAGLHKRVYAGSLLSFFRRMRQCPDVCDMDAGLEDYICEVLENQAGFTKYIRLDPIPATSTDHHTQRAWRLVRTPRAIRKEQERLSEFYPYLPKSLGIEDNLLRTIHEAVSRGLPDDIRADLCQDLVVSVLSGDVSLENVREAIPLHLRTHRRMYADRWRLLSLETPIGDGDMTIGDTL